jgi:hypothetical protein
MAGALSQDDIELRNSFQLCADVRESLLAHAGREWIDDECDSHRVA